MNPLANTIVNILAFVTDPLMVVFGFLMFRYPLWWAKMNARAARKDVHMFDSPKQLAHMKRMGILIMAVGVFSFFSMLFAKAMIARLI
jgi:hypothetical protein